MTSPDQPSKQARPSKPDRNRWRADLKGWIPRRRIECASGASRRAAPTSPAVDGVLDAAPPMPVAVRQDHRLAPADEEHRDAHGGQGGLALRVCGQVAQGAGVSKLHDLAENGWQGAVEARLGVAALEVRAVPGARLAVRDLLQAPPQAHAAAVQWHGLHVEVVLRAGHPGVHDEGHVRGVAHLASRAAPDVVEGAGGALRDALPATNRGHRTDLLPNDCHTATAAGMGAHCMVEAARAAAPVRARRARGPGLADALLVVAAVAGGLQGPAAAAELFAAAFASVSGSTDTAPISADGAGAATGEAARLAAVSGSKDTAPIVPETPVPLLLACALGRGAWPRNFAAACAGAGAAAGRAASLAAVSGSRDTAPILPELLVLFPFARTSGRGACPRNFAASGVASERAAHNASVRTQMLGPMACNVRQAQVKGKATQTV
eukprot:CAMPEP_0171239858 /NCGR_PEP_ID=MMETSP0790-20130122/44190_1 /TAXON_ID=2925 /ORGANISM="Alexandrium catenella, Strain OF101" /LENGTH=435 /DNA_ID=CAMNT_0011706237 /DNA_START=519 /DNA_END=1823 /DNA_ORIENTATION=+